MPFTYSGSPTSSARDAVRFLCGDISQDRLNLQDDEVDFILLEYSITPDTASTAYSHLRLAAAQAAEALAARYSKEASYSAGGVSESANDKSKEFRATARRLRREAAKHSIPFFGGRSKSAKETARQNTDLPQSQFTRDMMNHPGTDLANPDGVVE